MKKSIILISMAAAVIFSACQKSQNPAQGLDFTASVEQTSETGSTKTYLNGSQVRWSENDAISVFTDASENVKLTMSGGAGTTTGNFTTQAKVSGNPTCALYPYKAGSTAYGKMVSFTLPAEQTYNKEGFSDGANYAIANITGKILEFKNICGILRLVLRGACCVYKIELKGNSGEKLNGLYSVDASSADPAATCVSTTEESEQMITLNCNGVSPESGDSLFNFVVPVGAFTNGFSAKVYFSRAYGGTLETTEFSTSNDNTIERSKITKMPKRVISILLPDGYSEVKYIFGNYPTDEGYTPGPFIKTGVFSSANLITKMKYRYPVLSRQRGARLFGVYGEGGAYYVSTGSGKMGVGDKFEYKWGDDVFKYPGVAIDDELHVVTFGNGEFYYDDTLIASMSGNFTNPREIYLLACNQEGAAGNCGGAEVYYCLMYNDTGLIRDYIPVVKDLGKESEEAGLFDLVTNTFFGSNYPNYYFSYVAY